MATYHVSATGSQTAPYDTEAKAIHNTKLLKDSGLLVDGDTVLIDSDIVEPDGATAWTQFVTITSTKPTRPVVTCTDTGFTSISPSVANASSGVYTFDNLHINCVSFMGAQYGRYYKLSVLNCYISTEESFSAPLSDGFEMINCVYKKTGSNAGGMVPGMVFLGETTSVLIKNNVFISEFNAGNTTTGLWIMPLLAKSGSTIEIRDNIFYNPGTEPSVAAIFEPNAAAINVFEGNVNSGFGEWLSGSVAIDVSETNITSAGDPGFINSSGTLSVWDDCTISNQATLWRNMGTLLQSGIGMVPLTGWTFFLGASGSNTFPYSTPETAATQPISLKNHCVRNGDTINVVAGDEIVVNMGPDGQPWLHNVTIQSWSGNGDERPVIRCTGSFGLMFFMDYNTGASMSSRVSGLTIKAIEGGSPPRLLQCSTAGVGAFDGIEVYDMIYDIEGCTSGSGAVVIASGNPVGDNGIKFHDNLVMYSADSNISYPIDVRQTFGPGTIQISNNTFVFGLISDDIVALNSSPSPNNLQTVDLRQNIIFAEGGSNAEAALYEAMSSLVLGGAGIYDNICNGIAVANRYPEEMPTIISGTSFWENTLTDSPGFRDAASKDYATPYGPQPTWGWQGWLNDIIPAEPSRTKYKPYENKSVCDIVSGMAASMRTYVEIDGDADNIAPGRFVRRTSSGRARLVASLDDTRNSVLVLAMGKGNSGNSPEPKATVCGTAGVIVAIPESNISSLGMSALEEVVVIYSGEEAGMITTVDKADSGSYYAVGRCVGIVAARTGDTYHVELYNSYKVTK